MLVAASQTHAVMKSALIYGQAAALSLPCAGADVTHPLGFSHTEPSVGAIVGSLNKELSRFASRVWLQGHRVEMLQVLVH